VSDEKAAAEAKRVSNQKAAAKAKRVSDEKAAAEAKRVSNEKSEGHGHVYDPWSNFQAIDEWCFFLADLTLLDICLCTGLKSIKRLKQKIEQSAISNLDFSLVL